MYYDCYAYNGYAGYFGYNGYNGYYGYNSYYGYCGYFGNFNKIYERILKNVLNKMVYPKLNFLRMRSVFT